MSRLEKISMKTWMALAALVLTQGAALAAEPNAAATDLSQMTFQADWAPRNMRAGDDMMLIGPGGTPVSLVLVSTTEVSLAAPAPEGKEGLLGEGVFRLTQDVAYDHSVLPKGTRITADYTPSMIPSGPVLSGSFPGSRKAVLRFVSFTLP